LHHRLLGQTDVTASRVFVRFTEYMTVNSPHGTMLPREPILVNSRGVAPLEPRRNLSGC
jgi:hypothetical protein